MIAFPRPTVALGILLGIVLWLACASARPGEAAQATGTTGPASGAATPDGVAKDGPAVAAEGSEPFRPLFWDPDNRPQKPTGEVGAIRFLTTGDFPPFSFLDPSGRLVGYHVDLARVLCEELAATCTLQMRPFDELVGALSEKRGDAILAGLAVGAALRDRLDTTDAYLTTPGRLVATAGEAIDPTPEGLSGRWISVVSGSVHEAYALAHFPKARIAAYPDETSARDALRDRRVSVHFGDAIGLSFWLDGEAAHGCCTFAGGAWLEPAVFGEGLRIAVAKSNPRLKRHLDFALRKAAIDGRLGELYLRWFPRGYY